MVDLTSLLARHHSQYSHSSVEDDESLLSPTSEDEPMSLDADSPGVRRCKVRYVSESEGSLTEVRGLR